MTAAQVVSYCFTAFGLGWATGYGFLLFKRAMEAIE